MSVAAVSKAVKQVRDALPGVPVEVSGNITLENAKAYAKTGVDFLAVRALTASAEAADLVLRIATDAG